MVQVIGYTALSLNLISMSMKNLLFLRVLGLVANAIYVAYGVMIDAPPVYIGCAVAVLLHSYRIVETKSKKDNKMKIKDRAMISPKIRNVYLADLPKIISIYGNKPLKLDFGLPLCLVECDKEICGYAFVAFKSINEPEIQRNFKQDITSEETAQLLNEFAKRVFASLFASDVQNFTKLERNIKRLTDWLNLCEEQPVKKKSSIKHPLPTTRVLQNGELSDS